MSVTCSEEDRPALDGPSPTRITDAHHLPRVAGRHGDAGLDPGHRLAKGQGRWRLRECLRDWIRWVLTESGNANKAQNESEQNRV